MKRSYLGRRLGTATMTVFLLAGATARADPSNDQPFSAPIEEEERPRNLALRGVFGAGGGHIGFGGFYVLEGEIWFGSALGITGQVGRYAQSAFELFGAENRSTGNFATGSVAFRSIYGRGYGFFALGAGVASEEHVIRESSGLGWSGTLSPRSEDVTNTTHPILGAAFGWVWNLKRPLQIGTSLNLYTSTQDFSYIGLCFHIGGAG
jgi:hypothetical protein